MKSFDNIAESYDNELKASLGSLGGEDISIFSEYKLKTVKSKLGKAAPKNILEFGCGTGRNTSFLKKYFPQSNIYGCDISEKSLEIARKENNIVRYDKIMNADDLLDIYAETKIDCIFISNVFHHIPFNEHLIWLDSLHKILSEGGSIFIFEHNPYNPITRHIFKNSKIDLDATMLSPSYCLDLLRQTNFAKIKQDYTLFFIRRNRFFETIEQGLWFFPLGAQYYVWGWK